MPTPPEGEVPYLGVLGGLELTGAHCGSFKGRLLLALLLTETPQPLSRELLASYLWPESPAGAARSALRQTLHQLRVALEGAEGPPLVLAERQTLRLCPDYPLDSDIGRFRAALEADGGSKDTALGEAVAAYGGPFLEGVHLEDRFRACPVSSPWSPRTKRGVGSWTGCWPGCPAAAIRPSSWKGG